MDKLKLHLGLLRVAEQTRLEASGPNELGNYRQSIDGQLSPIHQLPDEILEEVMLYATQGSVDICAPTSDAWTMERVCHHWRNIALKLTTLWRTIDISLGALVTYKAGVPLKVVKNLLELCTSRARDRPLRLRLMDICPQETFMAVLRLVSIYSHQWETFYVSVSMLKETLPFERGLGQLTALELTGKYRGTAPLDSFLNAKKLTSLHLFHFPKPYLTLRIPWTNIQHLTISRCEFHAGEFVQLIRLIPNIVTFAHKWSSGVIESGKTTCLESVLRPRMRRLEVELYQHDLSPMLHHFTLPSLTDLTVVLVAARARPHFSEIDNPVVRLIHRSSCSLSRLSVSAVDSSSIYDILEVSPNVKELELDLVPDPHLILEYLVQPDLLSPDLETISLSLKEDQGVMCVGPLITLIQARSLTSGLLRQVTITMRESKGVEPFRNLLYPLRKETGVQVSITDYLRI
ncbi:hypothetical protein BJ165DRAFT_1533370 [Panaeolus papilionaceus]|nr:hypothetical protein BJ165DRAFT_1533370 [Panaeolus papilionaceus]